MKNSMNDKTEEILKKLESIEKTNSRIYTTLMNIYREEKRHNEEIESTLKHILYRV